MIDDDDDDDDDVFMYLESTVSLGSFLRTSPQTLLTKCVFSVKMCVIQTHHVRTRAHTCMHTYYTFLIINLLTKEYY